MAKKVIEFVGVWILMAVLIIIGLAFFNYVINGYFIGQVVGETEEMENVFTLEMDRLLEHTIEIAESGTINESLKNGDVYRIAEILNEEMAKCNVQTMLVADEDGNTVTRVPIKPVKGENMYLLTTYGRKVAQGEITSSIENGRTRPLIITTGVPIKENGEFIGGLFVGQELDNDYAKKIRDEYFQDREIAFFSTEYGIVGSSFIDNRIADVLATHYNTGSLADFQQYFANEHYVRIAGENYFVGWVTFEGVESTTGGALLLKKNTAFYKDYLASILVILLFVLIAFIYLKFIPWSVFYDWKVLILFILLILLVLVAIDLFVLEKYVLPDANLDDPIHIIYNSTMKMTPGFEILDINNNAYLNIRLFSGGEKINTISAVVEYDASALRMKDIVTSKSICPTNTFIENNIDNNIGILTVSCIIPVTGYSAPFGTIVDLLLEPLKIGSTEVKFVEGTQVLAHDGLGTDVLRNTTSSIIEVVDYSDYESGNGRYLPIIASPSHPNPSYWYSSRNIDLLWKCLDCKADEFVYTFSKSQFYSGEEEKVINGHFIRTQVADDGIYYFRIRAIEDKFNSVNTFRVQVDTTAPEPLDVRVSSTVVSLGDMVRIEFDGYDMMSGLESKYFYVNMGQGTFLPVTSPVYILMTKVGRNEVVIRAFDNAGNIRDYEVFIDAWGDNKFSNFVNLNLQKFFQMWD